MAMRACTLAFAISATITFAQAGYAQDRTFGDFDCTDDCSGHSAGYKWAERHSIEDEGNCPEGNSQSFHEGCVAYTRDPSLDPDSDNEGHAVGEPLPEPGPEDDDDKLALQSTARWRSRAAG